MPDSQTLILFVAAMVAGIICFRLYMILGRKTGQEPAVRSPLASAPLDSQRPQPQAAAGNGLLDLQMADRNFDTAEFLKGARDAYGRIVTAFAAGDRDTLRPLLSPDVMAAFDGAIAARGSEPAPAFTRLNDARIVGVSLQGRTADITVAFSAEFSGGPANVTDVWTFGRNLDSSDPNWTLVATGGDLPG